MVKRMAEAKAYKMIPHCEKNTITYETKELVRCADCRHAEVSQSGLIKCNGIFRSREWYCADGEKRNE
jgi:hypothetical protein